MKQKEVLRAVVILDTYDNRFAPLIDETPKVLLPLLGTPILNYTLEYLASNGVEEVYLCTVRHLNEIKSFVDSSIWASPSSPFKVKYVYSDELCSLGDIMREIEARDLFRSDFILITGDVISNIPLKNIINEHMERKKKDKLALMTLVYNQVLSNHTLVCKSEETFLIRNKESHKLLYYMKGINNKDKFKIPYELLKNVNFEVENDIVDTNIAICSADVLAQFTDNFDLQTRENFVKCILDGEELMGNSIFVHKTLDCYSTPISNFLMYDKVSQDMINNYFSPYIINSQFRWGNEKFLSYQNSAHVQDGVKLDPSVNLSTVAIGSDCEIGEDTILQNCVLGKNCKIGRNVRIIGSYLWDNIIIGDNCELEQCLLAYNCELKENVVIKSGSILGQGVIVGPNITLDKFTKISASCDVTDSSAVSSVLGIDGVGSIMDQSMQDEEEEEDNPDLDIWGEIRIKENFELDSSDESEDDDEGNTSEHEQDEESQGSYMEILDSLLRGVEENIKAMDIVHDINSLKFAHNISMEDLISCLTKALLHIPGVRQQGLKPQDYFVASKKVVNQYTPLFKKYVKREDDERCLLMAVELFFVESEHLQPILSKTLHHLYEREVVTEEAIIQWHSHPPKESSMSQEQRNRIRKCSQTFVEWLKNAEEESEDDD